jgi:hypothetical protein
VHDIHNSAAYLIIDNNIGAHQIFIQFANQARMNERLGVLAPAEAEVAKVEEDLQMTSTRGDWIFLKVVESFGCLNELESNLAKLGTHSVHADFRPFLSLPRYVNCPQDCSVNH